MSVDPDTAGAQVRRLITAAADGPLGELRELLQAGVDPNATDGEGGCALLAATLTGSPDTVIALLDAGAQVNARGPDGARRRPTCVGRQGMDGIGCGATRRASRARRITATSHAMKKPAH